MCITVIFYGVRSLDYWNQTCQNGHLDSCDSADTRHLWQISEFHAIWTTFVWAGNGPDFFKMTELHCLKCAKTLLIYHTWRSAHFKLKLFHPVLHDICFIWCYCCCCVLSQSAVKIPERFASVVDPTRLYWWDKCTLCYGTARKVHLTMVLFRAKSFQIGLIHSLLCIWQPSPTYIVYVSMVILAFTAFLV